jgi:hypothetical protein
MFFSREKETGPEVEEKEKNKNEDTTTHWPSIYLLVAIGVSVAKREIC